MLLGGADFRRALVGMPEADKLTRAALAGREAVPPSANDSSRRGRTASEADGRPDRCPEKIVSLGSADFRRAMVGMPEADIPAAGAIQPPPSARWARGGASLRERFVSPGQISLSLARPRRSSRPVCLRFDLPAKNPVAGSLNVRSGRHRLARMARARVCGTRRQSTERPMAGPAGARRKSCSWVVPTFGGHWSGCLRPTSRREWRPAAFRLVCWP